MSNTFFALAINFEIPLDPFLWFWTILIFVSVGWYGFLLFYIGFKGGREIKTMTQTAASKQKQNGTDQPKRQE
jgi:hypothetical protein